MDKKNEQKTEWIRNKNLTNVPAGQQYNPTNVEQSFIYLSVSWHKIPGGR